MPFLSKDPVPLMIRTYLDDMIIREDLVPPEAWWIGLMNESCNAVSIHVDYSPTVYQIPIDELYSDEPTVRIFTNSISEVK